MMWPPSMMLLPMSTIGAGIGASQSQKRNLHDRSRCSGFREPARCGRGTLLSLILPGQETACSIIHLERMPNSESLSRPHDQDPKRLLREKSTVAGPQLEQLVSLTSRYRSEEHTSELQSLRHLVCR